MIFPDQIPNQSVLGLNYSGMHDSAIAIVAPDGTPVFAVSLERLSRIKQDGRPPYDLLDQVPWDRISKIGISTYEKFILPKDMESKTLSHHLPYPRAHGWKHKTFFYDLLNGLPCEKVFVGHQLSHASSAFWGSEFDDALCLTCDGGMFNDPWFGGIYRCSRTEGIVPLDRFNFMNFAMITSIYSFVTALLDFTPNKHEGKITGLSAYGKPSDRCQLILKNWFEKKYFEFESVLRWVFSYSDSTAPYFLINSYALQSFKDETADIPREELAASVQEFAEHYVLKILENARNQGWVSDNICLAGGLFANVKINQRVVETGFKRLFVAPPMTDDGTALGAAWQVLSSEPGFDPKPLRSMFLGPRYSRSEIEDQVCDKDIQVQKPENTASAIASLLANGAVVAIFQGAVEFGPRALGNRSILAQATDPEINHTLNKRLNRTEFMPFAPMSQIEDAHELYENIEKVRHAAQFMTVTVNCTRKMQEACPAAVHVDGTARPQLVSQECNPLMHDILTRYKEITGIPALVNTSFNVHEEPIISSPEDALRGFFESGLDYLYLEGVGLISFKGNERAAIHFLQEANKTPSQKQRALEQIKDLLIKEQAELAGLFEEKESALMEITQLAEEKENALVTITKLAQEKDAVIQEKEAVIQDKESAIHEREAIIRNQTRAAKPRLTLEEKQAVLKILQVKNQKVLRSEPLQKQTRKLLMDSLYRKEAEIQKLESTINELSRRLELHRSAFAVVKVFLRPFKGVISKVRFVIHWPRKVLSPRLGVLYQYLPQELSIPKHYTKPIHIDRPPKISIITPSFRQGNFIERTIKSVLDQAYPNLEYYVQDGGSEDGTREILEQYADRLTGWESRPDNGQSQAINRGFVRTTGEIMAWLNSDDILLPGALAYIADYFNRHPEVDVVYGHRIQIDEDDKQVGRWMLPKHDDGVLSWADFIPQETLFWRRRIWEKVGGRVDESFRFALDWDLLVRFRQANACFARLPRFLGGFRIHEQQKTLTEMSDIGSQEMDRIRQRVLGRTPSEKEVFKAVFPYLLKHIITDLWWRIRNKLGVPS